ncbi:MAG TPA: YggS family pyridoxal phosphate-dependent enzyme, partial [Candidatus Limiplasma sp.]|nr:YggS family pyridoxal phosphate-dependent enzyme [Candidatus Limiplasma sp.]
PDHREVKLMANKAFLTEDGHGLVDFSSLTLRRLEDNVKNVLDDLHKNVYQTSSPARLIAVTKTVSAQVVQALFALGILDIGENRVQVAQPKLLQIGEDSEFRLHWIGRLQTNKVKDIIDKVFMLHSLDRLALAQEVERRAGDRGLILPALVQVNIAEEPQKTGLSADELLPFLKRMKDFPNIRVQGLMAMMPYTQDTAELERLFRSMRALFDRMRDEAVDGVEMRELSMGMSNDYAIAARCGATMVRVGTALYQ